RVCLQPFQEGVGSHDPSLTLLRGIVDLHGPICSFAVSSCWKPGSLRIGSQTGSIFRRAMETSSPAGILSLAAVVLFQSNLFQNSLEARLVPHAIVNRVHL